MDHGGERLPWSVECIRVFYHLLPGVWIPRIKVRIHFILSYNNNAHNTLILSLQICCFFAKNNVQNLGFI